MHLVYFDESGNTGNNLDHAQQPIFILAALVVPATSWIAIEADLQRAIDLSFPSPRPSDFEIHANELVNARGFFRQFPIAIRLKCYEDCLGVAKKHGLKVIHRAIAKKRYADWLQRSFGAGVQINPHIAAYALVAQVVNSYLRDLPGSPCGVFISDENKEVVRDLEKSHQVLRGTSGPLRLGQVIEKGFFIDSKKSPLLQLTDLCAYSLRLREEKQSGLPVKPLNETVIPWVEPLIHRGKESLNDVIAWLQSEQTQRKERPGA
jgi:hypothetical protein